MDKQQLDLSLRHIRLEERIVGDKNNEQMRNSEVSFKQVRLIGQPSKHVALVPHGRFRPAPMHTHNYYEMVYQYDGSLTQRWTGGSCVLEKGDFFIIPPGIYHEIDICGAGDIALNLILSIEWMGQKEFSALTDYIPSDRPLLIRTGNGPANETVCRMAEEILDPGLFSSETVDRLFSVLMIDLAREVILSHNEDPPDENLSQSDILYRIVRYIEDNYRTVTLAETAERFGYTPNYLSTLLRKELRQSFSDFRHSFCMAQAALLLRESTLSVNEVAEQSGFTNMTHFYKLFDRTFGVTPGDYRKLIREKGQRELYPVD